MRSRSLVQAGAVAIHAIQAAATSLETRDGCSVLTTASAKCPSPPTFLGDIFTGSSQTATSASGSSQILQNAFEALAVLQNQYFDLSKNTWPSAIDWTAAVIETVVAGMLKTLSVSIDERPSDSRSHGAKINLITTLYDQVGRSFFGQRVQELQQQAFDDMQWVVLGWLEAATFAETYGPSVIPQGSSAGAGRGYNSTLPLNLDAALSSLPWHGDSWLPSFFERAQTFWQLASAGWDDTLCHGGMNWNPRLQPYKNAVTNELWVASSISMYQYMYFQGGAGLNRTFLDAALNGYKWLAGVNMTNSQGLFVDGYHISSSVPNNIECDERDEMVYSYNQGILLTGHRGLFTVTGDASYLHEGHTLIQSVIRATGWDASADEAASWATLPSWAGLGRGGILEEQCDAGGTCSQDGQTFKGIFFHHLTAFCRALNVDDGQPFVDASNPIHKDEFAKVKDAHATACKAYVPWVKFNADAALKTRDSQGRFGMWWGAALWSKGAVAESDSGIDHGAATTTDYRNHGTPESDRWGRTSTWQPAGKVSLDAPKSPAGGLMSNPDASIQARERRGGRLESRQADGSDPNGRGRGRTAETQVGGLALLRAYWELTSL